MGGHKKPAFTARGSEGGPKQHCTTNCGSIQRTTLLIEARRQIVNAKNIVPHSPKIFSFPLAPALNVDLSKPRVYPSGQVHSHIQSVARLWVIEQVAFLYLINPKG